MENIFGLLILASLILLVIGFINPKKSLFWYKKERTRKASFFIYLVLTIIFFVLFGMSTDSTDNKKEKNIKIVKQLTQAEKDSITIEKEKAESFRQIELENQKEADRQKEIVNRKNNTISARDLTASYVANEVRADENFKGKRFFVTGKVTDIKKNIFDEIYVTLEGSEMFREVQCYFDDPKSASKLNKGLKVTFFGECDGLMMNVQMKDCKLVKNLGDL